MFSEVKLLQKQILYSGNILRTNKSLYHSTTCIVNLLIGNTNIIHTFLRLNPLRRTRFLKKHNEPSVCHSIDRTGVFMLD